MQILGDHLTEILAFLGGLLTGGIGVHFASNRQSGNSRRQDFRNAQAGGDMIGGNKSGKVK